MLLLTLLAALSATPVLAQHAGHAPDEPVEPPVDQPKSKDPHAGHAPASAAELPERAVQDPHAGHNPASRPASPSEHADSGMGAPEPREAPPPAVAFAGPEYAADEVFDLAVMQAAREDLRFEHGDIRTWWLIAERVEAAVDEESDDYLWDVQGWYGGDINKIWFKSEGEGAFGERVEGAEVQALWSRAVTPWFDFQAGARYDFRPDPERAHLVLGLQGLVPYKFEVDAAAFLSDQGELTARLEAEYDQRITQRLLLQPRIELDLSAREIPEIGLGSGVTSAEVGFRLRYEFVREFAPYVGVEYERAFGDTADYLRAAGEEIGGWEAVVGVRAWF